MTTDPNPDELVADITEKLLRLHRLVDTNPLIPDFPGLIAGILADVAYEVGGSEALIESRPGSWEADLVQRLALDADYR